MRGCGGEPNPELLSMLATLTIVLGIGVGAMLAVVAVGLGALVGTLGVGVWRVSRPSAWSRGALILCGVGDLGASVLLGVACLALGVGGALLLLPLGVAAAGVAAIGVGISTRFEEEAARPAVP